MAKYTISITSSGTNPENQNVKRGDAVCWSSSVSGYAAILSLVGRNAPFTDNDPIVVKSISSSTIGATYLYRIDFQALTTGAARLSSASGSITVSS